MSNILDLFTSKRFLTAFVSVISSIVVASGYLEVSEELQGQVVELIYCVAGLVITGYTVTDYATGRQMPSGYDHKGRKRADLPPMFGRNDPS